jgi:peptidoglycan hydrolase-like protein with peptidoglycan-binding domain
MKYKGIRAIALSGILAGFLISNASAVEMHTNWVGYDNGYDRIESVKTNSSTKNILNIQETLMSLGYNIGPEGADGVMKANTKKAIRQFQADRRIKVDGVVGIETAQKLNSYWDRAPVNYSSNVESIQQALMQLGYFVGSQGANGLMNMQTREAIKGFQIHNGINASGVVDAQTANVLSSQHYSKWQQSANQQVVYPASYNISYHQGKSTGYTD